MKALLLGGPKANKIYEIKKLEPHIVVTVLDEESAAKAFLEDYSVNPLDEIKVKEVVYNLVKVNLFGNKFPVWMVDSSEDTRNFLLMDYFLSDKAKEYLK